jgi:hypothetical protein
MRFSGDSRARIEAGLRAAVELGEVGAYATPRIAAGGVGRTDLDRRGRQQARDRPLSAPTRCVTARLKVRT